MSKEYCAAYGCQCEMFLRPKTGNMKKCADRDCQHAKGAHYGSSTSGKLTANIKPESDEGTSGLSYKTLTTSTSTNFKSHNVISLSDDEAILDSFTLPPSRNNTQQLISTPKNQLSLTTPISTRLSSNLSYVVPSFSTEVNEARKKAGLKTVIGDDLQKSSYKPIRIAVAQRTTTLPTSITFKCTIWTRLPEKSMIRGGPTQWWNIVLSAYVESYSVYLYAEAEKHAGWKERPQRNSSELDISTTRPILIGLMEAKGTGDPTTISVPEGGGTWHDLFRLVPGFLVNSPPPIIRGTKKIPVIGLSADRPLALILPVSLKSPPPTGSTPTASPSTALPISPPGKKPPTVRQLEKIQRKKGQVASKELQNVFVKKNTRRRSREIKKLESNSEEELTSLIVGKRRSTSFEDMSEVTISNPSRLEQIIQKPIRSSNSVTSIPPHTPPKSRIIHRMKRSRSVVSPPSQRNLGYQKPKRGREFDVIRDAIIDHQLEQAPNPHPVPSSSNIYNILTEDNSQLWVEEETEVDTDESLKA